MKTIRLLLVDDHELIRSGIRMLLQDQDEILVVGEEDNGLSVLEAVDLHQPHVVLMDIEMPEMNGLKAAEAILEKYPTTSIILLTMYRGEHYLQRSLEIGCRGYLLKQSDTGEIIQAIRAVHSGEVYFGSGVSKHFMKLSMAKSGLHPLANARLSKREIEVLCQIAEGLSSKEIAERLFISVRTVETHRSNILHKLKLSNTAQLVRYAIKNQLVDLS